MASQNLHFPAPASVVAAIDIIKTKLHTNVNSLEAVSYDSAAQATVFVKALRVLTNITMEVYQTVCNTSLALNALTVKGGGGVEKLRRLADEHLQSKTMTMHFTSVRLVEAIETEVAAKRVDMHDLVYNGARTTAAYNTVVAGMVMSAFVDCNAHGFPEILRFDHERFQIIHTRIELHTVVATALSVINQSIDPKRVRNKAEMLQEIAKCLIDSPLCNLDFKGRALELHKALPSDMSQENVDCISECLAHNFRADSAAFKLISTRMKSVVHRAFHGTVPEVFKTFPPYVIVAIGAELRKHIQTLRMVLNVNLQVYASHYNRMIQETARSMTKQ